MGLGSFIPLGCLLVGACASPGPDMESRRREFMWERCGGSITASQCFLRGQDPSAGCGKEMKDLYSQTPASQRIGWLKEKGCERASEFDKEFLENGGVGF